MADEPGELALVTFTFEYLGHGWARASISDGQVTYTMDPSYVPNDPLFDLVRAVAHVLTYGGHAECDWFYEPAADRWLLDRDGDMLTIAIPGVRDGFTREHWYTEWGQLKFSAACDIWRFAAKVRTAASRLEPPPAKENDHFRPAWVKESAEYRALCSFLDERKIRLKRNRSTSHQEH